MVGWGGYYLSTVLDDYARYIIAWMLRTSMQAADVKETLDLARGQDGNRPGPGGASAAAPERQRAVLRLGRFRGVPLETHKITHTRGAPHHPMTQGKIERYHRSMKSLVKLEKYYSPWELERAIARFVDDYNDRRLHEALDNVTPLTSMRGGGRRSSRGGNRSNEGRWHN